MKHRLRHLARSKKPRLTKAVLSRTFIFLSMAILLSPLLTILLPARTGATGTNGAEFSYIDNASTGAKAVGIMAATTDGPQRYHRPVDGTPGYYNGGTAQGYDGCTAIIVTDSHRWDSTSGATWYASCSDGIRDRTHITIDPFKNVVGKWIDHSHIQVGSTVYYDAKIDDNDSYSATNQNNGCDANVIDNFPHKGGDPANAGEYGKTTITIHEPVGSTNTNCRTGTYLIAFDDTNNYAKYFSWVDSGTIQTSDGTAMIFAENDPNQKGHYFDDGSGRSSDTTCVSGITADPNNPEHGTLVIRNSSGNPFPHGFSPQITGANFHDNGGCKVSERLSINIAGTANAKKPPGTGSNISGNSNTAPTNVGCDWGPEIPILGIPYNPLNWVFCGMVKGLGLITTALNKEIVGMLSIGTGDNSQSDNPNYIFSDNGTCGGNACDNYEKAWESFRNIALGLLVIVGLIIVVSQALGMEILDAYTIRKMLPRVLIATVAITLSWQLMKFMVTLSNDLGYGIGGLLWSPFSSMHPDFRLNGIGTVFAGLAGVFSATAILDAMGLLSFIGTAAIAVFITFLVLILRQIAVILLIVLSPIAIIAYVLPNTQRVYKFWWESFSKMLLMFPLIVAFLTAGYIFSAITVSQSHDFIHQVIGFVAYFGPYFAIPMTFRFAGSIMGGIGNAVNSRGEGARNALRGFRANRRKENIEALKRGDRWQGTGLVPGSERLARRIGKISSGASTGIKGRFGLGHRGQLAAGQLRERLGVELQRDPRMQAIAGDDNALRALVAGSSSAGEETVKKFLRKQGYSEEAAGIEAKRAVSSAVASGGFNQNRQVAAFNMLAQGGTGVTDIEDLTELAEQASNGDVRSAQTLMARGTSVSGQVGRFELNPGAGTAVTLARAAVLEKKYGKGQVPKPDGSGYEDMQSLYDGATLKAAGSQSIYMIANNAKGIGIKEAHNSLAKILASDRTTADQKKEAFRFIQRLQAGATLGGQTSANYAKEGRDDPRNKDIIEGFAKTEEGKQIAEEVQSESRSMREDWLQAQRGKPPGESEE